MKMADKDTLDFVFENCPCLNLRKSMRETTRFFEDQLSPFGINVSKLILIITIARSPGISQKELSKELSLKQSSLSRSIQEVVQLKWVKAKQVKVGTKKVSSLFITPKGIEKIEEVAPIWLEGYQAFLDKISQNDWTDTLKNLNQINFEVE